MVSHPSRRVSADTVTALSMELAQDVPPPPDIQELVEQHRARLEARVAVTERARAAAEEKGSLTRRFTRAAARAKRDAETFGRLVSEAPEGMRLAAVYHAPRAEETAGDGLRDPVIREYVRSVARRLHRHVATHHAEELRALGVCDHGIAQLRVQREARTAQGRSYDMDADHIIERESAGTWATRRGADPDDPEAGEKFLVNFFGNLTLLRGKEHRAKNRLKHLQMPQKADRARAQWYLSYVTERGEGQSGFIMKPQGDEALPLRPLGPLQRLQHIVFRARQAGDAEYRVRTGLMAETGRKRVDLSAAFNGAAKSPVVLEQAEVLREAMREAARQAETAFAEASRELHLPRQRTLFSKFRIMWRNRALRGLRRTAAAAAFLPEGEALRAAFSVIDGKVAATAEAVAHMPPPVRRKKKRHKRAP